MFVYNVKLNSRKLFKVIFILMIIFAIVFCGFAVYRVIFKGNGTSPTSNDVYQINSGNYTNILKAVHDDMNTYIGQKISFSGYVYRVYDLQDDEFVLARDMVVSTNFQTVVVGFLCSHDNAKNFKDGTWVSISGTISKGYYHGDMPVIKIDSIEETTKPKDAQVYPPDDYYIPTSSLIVKK